MDIVAIENKTFEQMKQHFEDFSRQVKNLCGDNQNKEKWLGNDDVCCIIYLKSIPLKYLKSIPPVK